MKKRFILIPIAMIVIIVIFLYFWMNRTIVLCENEHFKQVYHTQSDVNNIEIDVITPKDGKISTITDEEDITAIVNAFKDERISPNVELGETLLGGADDFIIRNKANNSSVEIAINATQIVIHHKTYQTENDIKEKIKDIYLKYNANF
ncbi:MAG: hypothetical protein PHP54_00220 [Clostridia bacterium]|nr:hypothetical protein [Clostridia bacterium]